MSNSIYKRAGNAAFHAQTMKRCFRGYVSPLTGDRQEVCEAVAKHGGMADPGPGTPTWPTWSGSNAVKPSGQAGQAVTAEKQIENNQREGSGQHFGRYGHRGARAAGIGGMAGNPHVSPFSKFSE